MNTESKLREALAQPSPPSEQADRNRATTNPGGCECAICGSIFIGGPEHEACGRCHAEAESALAEKPPEQADRAGMVDECKRLAEDMADKACGNEAGEFVSKERARLHAAIDALASQPAQEQPAFKIYKGDVCYKSAEEDQSFGMWCPVSTAYQPTFPEGTEFYATAQPKQQQAGAVVSDEQISDLWLMSVDCVGLPRDKAISFARAVLALSQGGK